MLSVTVFLLGVKCQSLVFPVLKWSRIRWSPRRSPRSPWSVRPGERAKALVNERRLWRTVRGECGNLAQSPYRLDFTDNDHPIRIIFTGYSYIDIISACIDEKGF